MTRSLLTRGLAVLAVPLVVAFVLVEPAAAAPPPGGTGGIVGTVTRADGSPLATGCISTDTGFSATTDPTGAFRLSGVSTGGHLVRIEDCGTPRTQASEWYDGEDQVEKAQTVWVYPDADTALQPITLRAGGFITGSVKNDAGPVGGYCVDASIGPNTFAKATTVASGAFLLGPLPPGDFVVRYLDCRGLPNPYADQWSPASTDLVGAKAVTVPEGTIVPGIDQDLDHPAASGTPPPGPSPGPSPGPDDPGSDEPAPVAVVAGRVTDDHGSPIQDVCVVAFSTGSVAGSTQTDSHGDYELGLDTTGPVKVQFVDCTGTATFAGEWYPNRPSEAAGDAVVVPAGGVRAGVDAQLSPGAPGSISGTVTNRRGNPIGGICVVAYLPYRYTVPALVGADGSFTISGVPSGTYALGFLTCRDDADPLPWVDDPETPGLRYAAAFWPHGTIRFDRDRVDPWLGGGQRVVVAPGQQLTGYDQCFGCVGITIDQVTSGVGTVTIAFTAVTSERFDASMLAGSVSVAGATEGAVSASAVDPTITYTATCRSGTGGVTGTASGTSSPLTVSGLTPGAAYSCSISAADGVSTLGTSDATVTVVATATGQAEVPTDDESSPPAQLAATGNGFTAALAIAGWTAWFAGLALTSVARRRRDAARSVDIA